MNATMKTLASLLAACTFTAPALAASQTPVGLAFLGTPSHAALWHTKPSYAVHMSHPEDVAQVIERAARDTL